MAAADMPHSRDAAADAPVFDLIRQRWSPRSFRPDPVTDEDLRAVFEAARWAPSNGNSQPWRYLLTFRGEPAHRRLVATLNAGNRRWAPSAPVLVAAYARTTFPPKGDKPARTNPTAQHDLGLANAILAIQATALGLHVHFMAGFDADALLAAFPPPADTIPVTVFAIGSLAEPDALPEDLRTREVTPRVRRPRAEFVVVDAWPDAGR